MAEVRSIPIRRGVPLLGAADLMLIFFTILKALGDRVAFAAQDCAAHKFSDGRLGEVGLPEKMGRGKPGNQDDWPEMLASRRRRFLSAH